MTGMTESNNFISKRIQFFTESLAEICAHSKVAPGRRLRWIIIANPTAGGFVIPSRWKKSRKALKETMQAMKANPPRKDCVPAAIAAGYGGVILTEGPGSAAKTAGLLIKEIENTPFENFYLIITAGGDGTGRDILSAIYRASGEARSRLAVIRLPMGTGNDGADSPDLEKALELLIKPSHLELMPALRLVTSTGVHNDNFLAFNILSVGVDAFITHMTNKMKGKLPGDFYKLWVDIASLLYDRLYTVDYLDITAIDGVGDTIAFREKLLLLAVGVSGHRTYGSQKKILPDSRNVCAIKQMPLLRKLAIKGHFSTGNHINRPEAVLFNSNRVEISGNHPILAQMDGETVLLQREDFPIIIELTEPVVPVLKPAE